MMVPGRLVGIGGLRFAMIALVALPVVIACCRARRFGHVHLSPHTIHRVSPCGAAAAVSLRPIVAGHLIVIPTRKVRLLRELDPDEMRALFDLVRDVQVSTRLSPAP